MGVEATNKTSTFIRVNKTSIIEGEFIDGVGGPLGDGPEDKTNDLIGRFICD